jgi:K+-transporting ATPase c subunit
LQNLNEIEPKSIKSIFLPSHIEDILLWIVCDCVYKYVRMWVGTWWFKKEVVHKIIL